MVRNPQTAERLEKIGTPNHVFLEAVPEAQRMSRADLIKTANMYFSGMQQNDGKGVYPFTDDCNRIENGMQTTNAPLKPGQTKPDPATATNYSSAWGCKEQFQSGLSAFRDAHSRPALRGGGSRARAGVQLRLFRSFGRKDAPLRNPQRP